MAEMPGRRARCPHTGPWASQALLGNVNAQRRQGARRTGDVRVLANSKGEATPTTSGLPHPSLGRA